jgi:glycosyltransferase involved in cell wall biosynthesis
MTTPSTTPGTTPSTIAYVMTHYPRVTQTFIADEIAGLRAAGHTVVTIALNPPTGWDAEQPDALDTLYLKTLPKRRVLGIVAGAARNAPGPFAKVLATALRTAGTDAAKLSKRLFHFVEAICTWHHATAAGATHLHAHFGTTPSTVAMWAAEYARQRGEGPTRWSFSYHSASEMYDTSWALNRAKAASADVVVCVSDQTRSNMLRTCDPADWAKVQVVRLGIDLDDFAYREPPPPADPPVVTVVGRLAPEKGHLVLVEAMALLAAEGVALRARIVGGGDLAPAIAAAVRDAGLDDAVDLVGEVAPSEVRPLVASSDIFCLPTFDEGLPVSIMEAMAVGVPVVTTYVNGIPELAVDGHTAMVVPAGNAEALADALRAAATDVELRARLAAEARKAVEAHHDKRNAIPAFIDAILDQERAH